MSYLRAVAYSKYVLHTQCSNILRQHKIGFGDHVVHFFSSNNPADIAFRLGATLLGAIPVTINWDADTPERVAYKIKVSNSSLVLIDPNTDKQVLSSALDLLKTSPTVINATEMPLNGSMSTSTSDKLPTATDTRIVIFTSGNSLAIKIVY